MREARVDRFKAELKARMRVRSIDIESFPVLNAELFSSISIVEYLSDTVNIRKYNP